MPTGVYERKLTPLGKRLWRRLEPEGGCLVWVGARDPKGYGRIGLEGKRRVALTHRVAWELVNGPVPDGLNVLHHCDNPPCCWLPHLFLGTLVDNNRDMREKGRHARGGAFPSRWGEGASHTKLTWAIADFIRDCSMQGPALARMLGVSNQTIWKIRRGKSWLKTAR